MSEIIDQKEFKKLIRSLRTFAPKIQKNVMVGSTRAAANAVRDEIRSRTPVKTGSLKKGIVSRKRRSAPQIIKFSVEPIGQVNPEKARWLEYGTVKMKAKPFIRPAFYSVGNKPLIAARAYFKPRLEKEKKKMGWK